MPTIDNLVLQLALDSGGKITASAEYDVAFTAAEKSLTVTYDEKAVLYERRGLIDDWFWQTAPPDEFTPGEFEQLWRKVSGPGDSLDSIIAVLGETDDLEPSAPDAEEHRSFSTVLNSFQRDRFIGPGREHPYVLVYLTPKEVSPVFALQGLVIDVGGPDTV